MVDKQKCGYCSGLMKVHEIMTAHARCVSPDNTLVEAAGLMREMDVGALPVCENDRLAGMLTDRDMTVRAIADGRDPNTTAVRDVMTPGIVYVFADQDVEEAARQMQEREIRRLPVLNREKRLVGIVSLGDIAMSSNPAFSGITLREVSQPENPDGRQRKRDAMGRAAGAGSPPRRREETREMEREEAEPAARSPRKRAASTAGTSQRTRGGARQQRQRKSASSRGRSSATKTRGSTRGGSRQRKTTARASR